MNRRTFLTRGAGAALGLAGGGMLLHALAQDGNLAAGMIDQNTQQAIDNGLRWLAAQQAQPGHFGTGALAGNVAVTSLAGLAFMAGGHQPGRGRYGDNITRAVRYIVSCEDRNRAGFITSQRGAFHGPMYGHGFATLFLAEVYGMINQSDLRNDVRGLLRRSIDLIVRSQNNEGGWRYQPQPHDADLSVTICQIMALRAARNAGIAVPKRTVDECTKYVMRCQDGNSGGFRYQAFAGGTGFARTAAGVVALNSAGIYLESPAKDSESVRKGLDYLKRFKPGAGGGGGIFNEAEMHYFYGHYYAVQAMWIAGGDYWRQWYPAIRNELLARRRLPEGYWQQGGFGMCIHYSTAMALIILQVPNNYLPILQR